MKKRTRRPRRPQKEIGAQQAIPAPGAAKGTKRLVFKSGATMDVPADVSRPEPAEESVFRLLYRLIEDLQRVRLSHGNRTRQVIPLIPPSVTPPRTIPTWEAFFKVSAETLAQEEARLLALATHVVKEDPVGRWLLAQKGVGPALAVSILGETWPLSRFKNPGKLWAFGGLDVTHGVGVNKAHPRITRDGEKSYRWNWRLKTRLYLFGVSVVRAGGPWRDLYDQVKAVELEKLERAHAHIDAQKVSAPPGRPHREDATQTTISAPGGAPKTLDIQSGSAPAGAQHGLDAQMRVRPGGAQVGDDAQSGFAPAGTDLGFHPAGAQTSIDARTGDAPGGAQTTPDAQRLHPPAGAQRSVDPHASHVPGGAHDSPDAPTNSAPAGAQWKLDAQSAHAPGGAQVPCDPQREDAPAGAHTVRGTQGSLAPGGAQAMSDAQSSSVPAGTDLEADRAQQDNGDQESPQPVGLRGHAHNRALRKVAKCLLLDLWRVAHDQPPLVGVV